jgi:hypothetical protein
MKCIVLILGFVLSASFLFGQDTLKYKEVEIISVTRDFELERIKEMQADLSDKEFAIKNAINDFDTLNYTLYSDPFFPDYSIYLDILRLDYGVDYVFKVDSQSEEYYKYYDSTMISLLKQKYGSDFMIVAQHKADSLGKVGTWYSNAKLLRNGKDYFREYMDSLSVEITQELSIDSDPRRVFISALVDSVGVVHVDTIIRAENDSEQKIIKKYIEEMPQWTPTYRLGQPVSLNYVFPLVLGKE